MILSQVIFTFYINLISGLLPLSSSFSTAPFCTNEILHHHHSSFFGNHPVKKSYNGILYNNRINNGQRRNSFESCCSLFAEKEDGEQSTVLTFANTIKEEEKQADVEFMTTEEKGKLISKNDDNGNYDFATTMMVLIFIVGSLCSLDRVAMSVALVPMSQEMDLSDSIKGSISSFFSIGYGLMILPAGLLLSKLSPRFIMAVGICLWSAGTVITPYSVGTGNMSLLLGARTLVGASESVVIPSVQRLLSNWIPPEKKGFALGIVFCGFQFGTIMAYLLSPQLIDYFADWRAIFYLYGGAGLLFLIPWLGLAKDSPNEVESEKTITEKNTKMIIDDTKMMIQDSSPIMKTYNDAKQILLSAPWKDFRSSRGVWAMFFAHAANNWGLYNNLSWTPTFYSEQYGLNVKESAFLLIVPSVAGAIGGLSSGRLADFVIQRIGDNVTQDDITKVRRIFQGIALLGPSLCLATLASNIPEEPVVAQTLFAAALGLQSFNAAGYGAANQEKAGSKWTGLLYSITSLPSVAVGTFGNFLTGKILDATSQNWSYVFGLNSFVYMLGGLAFITLYDSKKEFD